MKKGKIRRTVGEKVWNNSIKVQLSDAVWEIQQKARRDGREPKRFYAELMNYLLEYAAFVGHERGVPLEEFSVLAEDCFEAEYGRKLAREK